MIKPLPMKVTCKDCGFKKIFAPKSDAIMEGEYNHEFCTKCKSTNINVTTDLSIIDTLFSSVFI